MRGSTLDGLGEQLDCEEPISPGCRFRGPIVQVAQVSSKPVGIADAVVFPVRVLAHEVVDDGGGRAFVGFVRVQGKDEFA